jgi:hypothetical protein
VITELYRQPDTCPLTRLERDGEDQPVQFGLSRSEFISDGRTDLYPAPVNTLLKSGHRMNRNDVTCMI